MFLIIAAEIVWDNSAGKKNQRDDRKKIPSRLVKHCGILMGFVQGFLALCLGRVGSMGLLAPIGYIVPGMAIDLIYYIGNRFGFNRTERMVFANALAAVMASVIANIIVFSLRGPVLWLYLSVSATSGTMYGFLGVAVVGRLSKICSL